MSNLDLFSALNIVSSKSARARVAAFAGSAVLSVCAAACAGGGRVEIPENARVDILQTESLTLRGKADAATTSLACSAQAPSKPQHILELRDDTSGNFRLRAPIGEPALALAMLHVTHLESKKTWCTTTQPDGRPTIVAGGFPSGTYAISVASAGAHAATPRYEVVVQRL